MPSLDEILMGTQPDTRPATPADAQIGQAMTPPAQPAAPGETGNEPARDPRSLAANSSTFKPLTAANPDDKDGAEIIDLFNHYLAAGKSIDDLPTDVVHRVMHAAQDSPVIPDDTINKDPELFYQLKFRQGKYEPRLLDDLGSPQGLLHIGWDFAANAVNTVKNLFVAPFQQLAENPLSEQGMATKAAMLASGIAQVPITYGGMVAGAQDIWNDAQIRLQRATSNDPVVQQKLDRQQSEIIRNQIVREQNNQRTIENSKNVAADVLHNFGLSHFSDVVRATQLTPEEQSLAQIAADPATYLTFGAGKIAEADTIGKVGVRFGELERAASNLSGLQTDVANQAVARTALQGVLDSSAATSVEKLAAQKSLAAQTVREAETAKNLNLAQTDHQAALASVNQDLTDSARPSFERNIVGKTTALAGQGVKLAGDVADWFSKIPENIVDKLAPNLDEGVRAGVIKVLGKAISGGLGISGAVTGGVTGGPLGAIAGGLIGGLKGLGIEASPAIARGLGRDLAMVGEQFAQGQETLPFWKSVKENTTGLTHIAASMLDNQLVYAIPDTTRATAVGSAIGGAQGFVASGGTTQGTTAGAAAGGIIGAAGAGLGQIKKFNSVAELHAASIGDRAGFIRALSSDTQKLFSAMQPQQQLAISVYARTHPDLTVG